MNPTSLVDFSDNFLGVARNRSSWWIMVVFAAVAWSLWKTRNDWVFSNILLKSSKGVAHKCVGFLLQWTRMTRKKDVVKMEEAVQKLKAGLSGWRPP